MKGFVAEIDGWSSSGAKITDAAKLQAIRETTEKKGPVIVEHRFYRGARAPDVFVFEEYDEFVKYLDEHGRAGDRITVWSFWDVCKPESAVASGKCPDDAGRVPERGAY
jgi:hypothetical protein